MTHYRTVATALLLALHTAFIVSAANAQSCKEDFRKNPYLAGNNYVAYPGPQKALTPAPKGYEPVYLSHYGRHGSRYHIGDVYGEAYKTLLAADSAGVLTAAGKELLANVVLLKNEAAGRDGELTELGALQHQQIAERMFNKFPQMFNKETHIDAKSTVVIRCILSMENALMTLKSLNPKLDIRHDASYHDMYYMNQSDSVIYASKKKARGIVKAFRASHTHPQRLMSLLFNDSAYWQKKLDAQTLMRNIYKLAMNVQSSEIRHTMNLTGLFTEDERYDLWQAQNAYWYLYYGPSRYTDGVQPYSQRNLLHKIISEADSCLRLDNCGAHLRYGHDTMVMPLTCLLELDDTNRDIPDLNTLPQKEWCDYRIFPMACNLQFVFYRSVGAKANTSDKDSKNKDILVKVLRNENEARLPVKTNMFPYYRWSDVKAYYLKKLAAYEATRQ